MKRLGLVALMLASVLFISPVNAVFFTARERSQRYTFFGVRPPDGTPPPPDGSPPEDDETSPSSEE